MDNKLEKKNVFRSANCKNVRRDYNKAVHFLAQFARQRETSQVWLGVCPPMLAEMIHSDCMY